MIEYYIVFGNFYLYNMSLEEYMKYDPPCKECLIQSMCLEHTEDYSRTLMNIIKGNACENLRKFLEKNKSFESI